MAEKYIIQIPLYPKVLNRFLSLFSPLFFLLLQYGICFQLKLLPSFFCRSFHEEALRELRSKTELACLPFHCETRFA